jgi:hypothetical protein
VLAGRSTLRALAEFLSLGVAKFSVRLNPAPQPPILATSAQATRKGRLSGFGDHFAEVGCCASRI